ncbi:hypothetical protein SLS54_008062 [Diplodia seriata]
MDLPQLSADEYQQYNRCAVRMNFFHNMFRHAWTTMYEACEANKLPAGMSLGQFFRFGLDFCNGLKGHHGAEERSIFPYLAKKMPAFRKELELLTQHKQIHAGLDSLTEYLEQCKEGQQEFRMQEMKEIMSGFGTVLWEHLNDEVEQLGAENMRKYWTLEEMRDIPM